MNEDPDPVTVLIGAVVVLMILGIMYFIQKKKDTPASDKATDTDKKKELSSTQKKDIVQELERHAKSEGNDIDATIGFLKLGMKEYLPSFLKGLEESEAGILTKAPGDLKSVLILADTENRPLLPIFTRNEYADNIEDRKKDYRYMTWVPMKSLCGVFSREIGLVINPKHGTFEYIMPSDLFAKFREIASGPQSSLDVSGLDIEILSIDAGAEELEKELPILSKCIKRFSSEDGSDYVLTLLNKSIRWKDVDSKYLVVGARLMGHRIQSGVSNLSVNIAVVMDESLTEEKSINFDKAEFAATGLANDVSNLKS